MLWDKRRHECDFKTCVGNFWLLCSIFPLFDCLYWIQNWVFFQLDTFQWVIWWCELSKGRCELNCMWQVNVTRGGLIITEYALRKSRGWQMSSLNELQTQDRLSATERHLSCKPALYGTHPCRDCEASSCPALWMTHLKWNAGILAFSQQRVARLVRVCRPGQLGNFQLGNFWIPFNHLKCLLPLCVFYHYVL